MSRNAQLEGEPTASTVISHWPHRAVSSAAVVAGGALALAATLLSSPELHRSKPSEAVLISGEAECRRSEASCPAWSSEAGRTETSTKAPSFFAYLEFDWDPDAPGGIPGFGPLPASSRSIYVKAAKELLSNPAGM